MSKKTSELNLELYPKQDLAFRSLATDLLFGGASEGGKSHFIRVSLIFWCSLVPGLQCRIFREYFDDVVDNHMNGPNSFNVLLAQWVGDKLVEITKTEVRFWNGSLIQLGHLGSDRSSTRGQGKETHVLVFDEATYISHKHIAFMRGWCRMPLNMQKKLPEQLRDLYPEYSDAELEGFFPRIISTANPIGKSVGYFRRQYVKARAPYAIERASDEEGGFLRQYIPSTVYDNPSADPEANKRRLSGMGAALAQAMHGGDWDAPIGDYFKDFSEEKHVIPAFKPPQHWFKWRSFDWGSGDPFAVYWLTISDGEEFIDHEGRQRFYPLGCIIVYREWYGCSEEDQSKGLHMRNEDIATGIVARTSEVQERWITLTDSYPFNDLGMTGPRRDLKYTIADIFQESGVTLTRGNTARLFGWGQIRDRLKGGDRGPMLLICDNCQFLREYLPALETDPSNPEDAVQDGEATHACDALRLGVAAKPLVRKKESPPLGTAEKFREDNYSIKGILEKLDEPERISYRGRR